MVKSKKTRDYLNDKENNGGDTITKANSKNRKVTTASTKKK